MLRLPLLPSLLAAVLAAVLGFLLVSTIRAAGPPFPEPVADRAVYDPAGAIRAETEQLLQRRIDAIEARTGAEIAVYLQVKPGSTFDQTASDARALMDQWGVGRAGFDDGLVVLFNLEENRTNGQVSLTTGGGFDAVYVGEEERQQLFESTMLPHLRRGDLDRALTEMIAQVDMRMDAGGRSRLDQARQLNAVLTLVVAPFALLATLGVLVLSWYRSGRDPRFLDSESILMAGPPAGMTPSIAAALMSGRSNQLAVTAALMELGRRGKLRFVDDGGSGKEVAIELPSDAADPDPHRPLSPGQAYLLARLRGLLLRASGGQPADRAVRGDDLAGLGSQMRTFHRHVEREAVELGWFTEMPHRVIGRWAAIGAVELIVGGALVWWGIESAVHGLIYVGGGLGIGGLATMGASHWMSQRTTEGARVEGMLKAYRRTLRRTLELSRSMEQVVADPVVHRWADTPDKAMVWGLALGLREEVAAVLERSLADQRAGAAQGWSPAWVSGSGSQMPTAQAGTSGAGASGRALFSPSVVPNVGAMLTAIGTIGRPPASSGGGSGGGGFGGGSSSGGSSSGGGF